MTIHTRYGTVVLTIFALSTLLACGNIIGPEAADEEVIFTFEQSEPVTTKIQRSARAAQDMPVYTGRFRAEGAIRDGGTYTETLIESPPGRTERTLYGWRNIEGAKGRIVLHCRNCILRDGVFVQGTIYMAGATGAYEGFGGSEAIVDLTTGSDPRGVTQIRFRRVR